MKEFKDDNFIVVQMVQLYSNRVENIVEKWENAGFQHFLLSPQCFKKAPFQCHENAGLFRRGLTHSHRMTPFDATGKQAF